MGKSKLSREYPPIYEKMIPVVLWTLGTVIVILLLLITLTVALRLAGTA